MVISLKVKIVSTGFLFFSCLVALAQPTAMYDEMNKLYGDHGAVIIKNYQEVNVGINGKGLDIYVNISEQIMLLNRKGGSVMQDQVMYDPHFFDIENLEANTWLHDGNKYVKHKVSEFQDVQSIDSESFVDSRRFKQFKYPNITNGAITECNYTYHLIDPVSIGSFTFINGIPSLQNELRLNVPSDVEFGAAMFGDTTMIEYRKETKGKITTHIWSSNNVGALKNYDFAMSDDHYRTHMYVYIKSYMFKGKKVNLLGGKQDLYNYNYQYIKNIATPPSDNLKQVVDSIKNSNSEDENLVKGIFYWVQDHVSYIAFEDGLGGFIPRPSNQVFEKKYGDCKDMANLIKSMMDYAGVPGYLCWVGTRSKAYSYDELPLPYCDNHMIAAYKKNGEYIYLDATSKEHRFGLPSIGIQGKQTMISIDENTFEIPVIPIVQCETNFVTDTVNVRIEGNNLVLKGRSRMDGFVKSELEERLNYAGTQNHKEEWLGILHRGNNKCKLENYSLQNFDNRDGELVVDYDLVIQDYVRYVSDEMYLNLNMDKTVLDMKPDTTDRICGADYLFALSDLSTYRVGIPEGYSIKQLPEKLSLNQPKYDITLEYSVVGNEILVDRQFHLKDIHFELAEIPQWVADLDKINKAFQQVVVLSKHTK